MTTLSKSQLQANVVDKKDSRKILHGIYVNHEESVSTDGKRLLRIKHQEQRDDFIIPVEKEFQEGESLVIPVDEAKSMASMMATNLKTAPRPVYQGLVIEPNLPRKAKCKLTGKGGLRNLVEINSIPIEGSYPNYKQVMPTAPPTMTLSFNVDLLTDLLVQVKKVMKERCASYEFVDIEIIDPQSPIIFKNKTAGVEGLIMPMRQR